MKGSNGVTHPDMDLIVATNPTEAQQIADTLSPERPGMRFEITNVNCDEYLVVAVYLGGQTLP